MAEAEYRFEKLPALPDAMRETMRRAVASAPPRCAGLIDQGRRIGDDPVGHVCPNVATGKVYAPGSRFFWRVCGACEAALGARDGRVSLAPLRAEEGEDDDA